MDIVYDHYLAKNWKQFSTTKLEDYADTFYKLLQDNFDVLTDKTQKLLPYMMETNWLVCYKSLAGLELILFQMDYRTKNRVNMPAAMYEIQHFYNEIEQEFFTFFTELELQSKLELDKIKNAFHYHN
jgi:acyl carrier protein phosphodiesterase